MTQKTYHQYFFGGWVDDEPICRTCDVQSIIELLKCKFSAVIEFTQTVLRWLKNWSAKSPLYKIINYFSNFFKITRKSRKRHVRTVFWQPNNNLNHFTFTYTHVFTHHSSIQHKGARINSSKILILLSIRKTRVRRARCECVLKIS
jgi:hypothetical protein